MREVAKPRPDSPPPAAPIVMGISACLLGRKVRYDGNHKLDRYLRDTLGRFVRWVPVCPETGCGLDTPREPMRLVGGPDTVRLLTTKTCIDHTARMTSWVGPQLDDLAREDLCGFVAKCRSPSCAVRDAKIYTEKGQHSRRGPGIFIRHFARRFPGVPVEDDGRLHDPALRENFVERVFVLARWRELLRRGASVKDMIDFHTDHKLLFMAHSPAHYSLLGRLAAGGRRSHRASALERYAGLMLDALALPATVKKHTNVLLHCAGFFKNDLSDGDKRELLETIDEYHRGALPLIVPIVLLRHYTRTLGQSYLKRQYYLYPHPQELHLRYHG